MKKGCKPSAHKLSGGVRAFGGIRLVSVETFNKMGQTPAFLVYFRSFLTQILQKETVGVCGIRTRIVRVEGKHADHLTTTTAH